MSPCVLACLLLVCVPVSFDKDYMKLIRGFTLATSVLYTPSSFLPSGHAVANPTSSQVQRGQGGGSWCQRRCRRAEADWDRREATPETSPQPDEGRRWELAAKPAGREAGPSDSQSWPAGTGWPEPRRLWHMLRAPRRGRSRGA